MVSKVLSLAHTAAASRRSLRAPDSALSDSSMTSETSNRLTGSGAFLFAPSVLSNPAQGTSLRVFMAHEREVAVAGSF